MSKATEVRTSNEMAQFPSPSARPLEIGSDAAAVSVDRVAESLVPDPRDYGDRRHDERVLNHVLTFVLGEPDVKPCEEVVHFSISLPYVPLSPREANGRTTAPGAQSLSVKD